MASKIEPNIESSWKEVLKAEFQKPYFSDIKQVLVNEKKEGKTIYPPGQFIFNAFDQTPFKEVNVVILGQDPYHGHGQAHGLCFSVKDGIQSPPSLVNVFKELKEDLGLEIPDHGNLEKWAQQGVFLLNAILTVRAKEAASHSKIGWQHFTNAVIRKLSEEREGLIFLLWGRFAQNKQEMIDRNKHHILTAAHPSPFSAYNGFFGCRHFSKANKMLKEMGKETIDWSLD